MGISKRCAHSKELASVVSADWAPSAHSLAAVMQSTHYLTNLTKQAIVKCNEENPCEEASLFAHPIKRELCLSLSLFHFCSLRFLHRFSSEGFPLKKELLLFKVNKLFVVLRKRFGWRVLSRKNGQVKKFTGSEREKIHRTLSWRLINWLGYWSINERVNRRDLRQLHDDLWFKMQIAFFSFSLNTDNGLNYAHDFPFQFRSKRVLLTSKCTIRQRERNWRPFPFCVQNAQDS